MLQSATPQELPIEASSSTRRRLVYTLCVVLVVAGICTATTAIIAIRMSLTAEKNLQAFFHVHAATLQYIEKNKGQWPTSWDDLRTIEPDYDFDSVPRHLSFDFNADPRELVRQTPQTFTAIKPHDPCYEIDDKIQQLIDKLNRYVRTE